MGFFKSFRKKIGKGFKKLGKGVSKGLSKIGGAVVKVAKLTPIGIAVTTLNGLKRGLGSGATKLALEKLGGKAKETKLASLFDKIQDKVAEIKEGPTVLNGTAGQGAELWQFSKSKDEWIHQKTKAGAKRTVFGIEYQWVGSYDKGYYGPAPIPPPPPPPPLPAVSISYEMLDSNAHQLVTSGAYRGRSNMAHLIYLVAREVFGDENNVINGAGGTATYLTWEQETKDLLNSTDERVVLDILLKTKTDLDNGGNGYIDEPNKKGKKKFFFSKRSDGIGEGVNSREAVETKNTRQNNGTIKISYDALLNTIKDMYSRKELIHTKDTTVRNILRKAFEQKPGPFTSTNRLIRSRTPQEWKQQIDTRIIGTGINKKSNKMFRKSLGAQAQHNLDWIDLMRVIGVTARSARKTGSGTVPNLKTKDVKIKAKDVKFFNLPKPWGFGGSSSRKPFGFGGSSRKGFRL